MPGQAFDDIVGRLERPEMNTFKEARVGQDIQPDGINLQLVKLRDKINVLHEQFSILEQKTTSICRPMPCNVQCDEKRGRDGSEMQSFLRDQNDRLDALLDRMTFMSESIDL